jgi:hypothetical protein
MEEHIIKQAMENKRILLHKRYVDDLLVVYDTSKTEADLILDTANKLDNNLTFKSEMETNNFICYLDIKVSRLDNQITIDIHRNPTCVDMTIHYTSNHPHIQKLAAFHFYTHRLNSLPLRDKATEQECHEFWQPYILMVFRNILYLN